MNAYRFSIRTHSTVFGSAIHAIDLAVSLPPEDLEPLLEHHRLVDGVAIGLLETEAQAEAAHHDLAYLVQLVDALGLAPAEDQSIIYRNRRLGQTFDRPLVLVDGDGDVAVLDHREPMPGELLVKNPLHEFGWEAGNLPGPGFSDGTVAQISSPVLCINTLQDRAEAHLGQDSLRIVKPEILAAWEHEAQQPG